MLAREDGKMGLAEIVLGIATVASATVGCAVYGVTDAKGTPVPGKEYVMPATAAAAFYFGNKIGLPDNEGDATTGVLYTGAAGIVGGVSYGLGYLIGALS